MVSQLPANSDCEGQWLIQPTRSMSWHEAKMFVVIVTLLSLAIGTCFFVQGFPLVLPFSGLEALAVAAAFYVVMRDGECREVVSIFKTQVVIEKGRSQPDIRTEFDRSWARVVLAHSPRRWYPSRLSIKSHGRSVELGQFLTNGEREALASALINAIKKNR